MFSISNNSRNEVFSLAISFSKNALNSSFEIALIPFKNPADRAIWIISALYDGVDS